MDIPSENKPMTYGEALKILDIEDYSKAIHESDSDGNLFHIYDYILIAKAIDNSSGWFRKWFVAVVETANKKWKRPESIYQYILDILKISIENRKDMK